MNSTLAVTSASGNLQNAFPSQAQTLLVVEQRERDRVERERESLCTNETALEQQLASELAEEERKIAQEGMKMLQEFNQHDLTELLREENHETERQAELVKNEGLAGVNKAAKILVDAALSKSLLSNL